MHVLDLSFFVGKFFFTESDEKIHHDGSGMVYVYIYVYPSFLKGVVVKTLFQTNKNFF